MPANGGSDDDALGAYEVAACGLLTLAPNGTIERVNGTMCRWVGLERGELVGRRFADLLTIGSKLFHQTHWLPLLEMQGSVAEVQLELVQRDGNVVPALVNAARRGDGRTDVGVFVATDRRKYERELLLARRRAEELLQREQEAQRARAMAEGQLRLALESASLRVWTVEMPSRVRRYEQAVRAVLGQPDLEVVTADAYAACIHPADRASEEAAFDAALDPAKREPYDVEYRLLGHDGVERIVRSTGRAFFDEAGMAVDFSGVLEEVTDRRRAEEALRLRENEFRTLAENSPDIIARFDREKRCSYVSPALETLTGRPASTYIGERLDELGLPEEPARAWDAALDEALAGRELTHAYRLESAPGGPREFQAHVVPERNGRGEIVSVLALTRDVTALRAQELEAQQRAEFAEQLIGIVSHDLRNPLNAVVLGAKTLEDSILGPQRRLVSRIVAAAQRASRLIADLLDFTQARLGGGLRVAAREVDVHGLVAECVEELRLAWPGRNIVHERTGEGVGNLDPDRIAQVVTNLANNALTYGSPDEAVTITTEGSDGGLELRVHNAGRPIPEALQTQIFEPLRRGDEQLQRGSRSVGLGLYIVRQIARAHGGRVTVRSGAVEGTTFRLELPRLPTSPASRPTR